MLEGGGVGEDEGGDIPDARVVFAIGAAVVFFLVFELDEELVCFFAEEEDAAFEDCINN